MLARTLNRRIYSDMVLRVAVMMVSVMFVTACGGANTSPQRLEQSRENLTSWVRSLQLLERQWQEGRVPQIYVQQMTKAAAEATNKQRKAIRSPPPDLAKLLQQLESETHRLMNQAHKAEAP